MLPMSLRHVATMLLSCARFVFSTLELLLLLLLLLRLLSLSYRRYDFKNEKQYI
jgi:hypothetical protein